MPVNKNWLFNKGARQGFLTIRDAAKFHNVSVYTIKTKKANITFIGSYTKIKFDSNFLNTKFRNKKAKRRFN